MKSIKGMFNKKNPQSYQGGMKKTNSTSVSVPQEDVNSYTQSKKAIPQAINYLVFWVDKNVDSDENKCTLRQLHIMGYRIFALSSIEKTQDLVKKLIQQKKDHLAKYPQRKYFANSIIIMSSGQLKDQIMDNMKVWASDELLENKILKLIVYCGNISRHYKSMEEHPDVIDSVINQIQEIPLAINGVIKQNEQMKQLQKVEIVGQVNQVPSDQLKQLLIQEQEEEKKQTSPSQDVQQVMTVDGNDNNNFDLNHEACSHQSFSVFTNLMGQEDDIFTQDQRLHKGTEIQVMEQEQDQKKGNEPFGDQEVFDQDNNLDIEEVKQTNNAKKIPVKDILDEVLFEDI